MKKNKLSLVFILLLIAFSLFFTCFFIIDPDYLWHIKAGEVLFNNGIIREDVFSWYLSSKYWMNHEWLFELVLYILKLLFGNLHLFIYCFSSVLSLLLFIFFTNKDGFKKNIIFSLIWCVLSLILVPFVQARPHLMSNILLAITIYLVRDVYDNKESNKIFFLPLVSIIWANVHGGSSSLVYLIPLFFLIFGLFEFKFSKIESRRISSKQIKKLLLVSILCMIGVCINIHGFRMFLYPYQNMLDKTMLNNITEWQGTSLNDWSHYPYFGILLIILLIFLISKKKIRFIDFMVFLLCTYFGLKSIRFWSYTYIIMSFFIFNYINERKLDKGTENGIVILSLLIIIFSIFNMKSILKSDYHYELKQKDINFIKSLKMERPYNMYNYGGDLIYNDILVFIDGRADLYTNYNYRDSLDISNLRGDYVKLIKKYNFDYLLVDKKYPISTYLKYSDEFDLIYNNKNFMVYKKKNYSNE